MCLRGGAALKGENGKWKNMLKGGRRSRAVVITEQGSTNENGGGIGRARGWSGGEQAVLEMAGETCSAAPVVT